MLNRRRFLQGIGAGALLGAAGPRGIAAATTPDVLVIGAGGAGLAAAKELKAKGVTFERYQLPDTVREGDIHVSGEIRNAWFKDPDGNIHALSNM